MAHYKAGVGFVKPEWEQIKDLKADLAKLEQDGKRLNLIVEHLLVIHPPEPSMNEFDGLWVVCAYELPSKVDCLSKNKDLRPALDAALEGE